MSEEQELTGNKVYQTIAQYGVTQHLVFMCVFLYHRRDPDNTC